MQQLKRFNMGAPGESDCPVFDGMYEYFAVRSRLGIDAVGQGARGAHFRGCGVEAVEIGLRGLLMRGAVEGSEQ
jgi:hypothetical protein